jgi:hypothetical protein
MEACEAREHGGDSKQNHQVEGAKCKQRSGWERLEGATPWSSLSRSNKASMSALGKSLTQLFVCEL